MEHKDIFKRIDAADGKFTRIMDWIFNAIGAGFVGWLVWMVMGVLEVGLLTQIIGAFIGAAMGVVLVRLFFFFGRFFG